MEYGLRQRERSRRKDRGRKRRKGTTNTWRIRVEDGEQAKCGGAKRTKALGRLRKETREARAEQGARRTSLGCEQRPTVHNQGWKEQGTGQLGPVTADPEDATRIPRSLNKTCTLDYRYRAQSRQTVGIRHSTYRPDVLLVRERG